jgi:hypothetical protein
VTPGRAGRVWRVRGLLRFADRTSWTLRQKATASPRVGPRRICGELGLAKCWYRFKARAGSARAWPPSLGELGRSLSGDRPILTREAFMITLEPEQTAGSDIVEQGYLPQSSPPPPTKLRRVAGAGDVYTILSSLGRKDREHFVALFLNCRHQVVRRRTVAIGSLNGVEIHPRELFKPAIRASSAAIIVAHNHPSGDPCPSRADIELTQRLREAGELLGIPILDHLIISRNGFISLAERGWR